MNLQQAKITLEKINRLYQSMMLDSKIDLNERDLMLNYIRQFYGAFAPDGDSLVKPVSKVNTSPIVPTPPVVQAEVKKVAEVKPTFTPPPPPAPPVKKEVPVVKAPPIVVPPPPKKEAVPVVSEVSKATPGPAKEPIAPIVKKQPATSTKASTKIKEEYEDLFEQDEVKDLSDRLSSSPIRDLTKAMGLNEKILTINELFGGNQQAMEGALKELNAFSNFEDAIPTLTELADTYKWDSRKAKKKAKVFVKLVQRRYL